MNSIEFEEKFDEDARPPDHNIDHIRQKHKEYSLEGTDLNDLRLKGDHTHNINVIKEGKGELILSRRPKKSFKSSDFGPCPFCREWILLSNIGIHVKKCKKKENNEHEQRDSSASDRKEQSSGTGVLKLRAIQNLSDNISGRIKSHPSSKLIKDVFAIMTRDEVSEIAKSDELIVSLGDSWYQRNMGNAKAKYMASQHMRLMAKFLIQLRQMKNKDSCGNDDDDDDDDDDRRNGDSALWDFLIPSQYNDIMQAALNISIPYIDDIQELKSPSNAIKIKYDLKRVVEFKWSKVQTNGLDKKQGEDCDTLIRLITIHCSESVTRLARTVLAVRSFNKTIEIPAPEDIEVLNKYVDNQMLHEIDLTTIDLATFRRAVALVQTKLLLFNKRRSGEIDQITVKQYAQRRKELEDVDESLIGELTDLERKLLESHDLMVVRGKRTRPVPVIIPESVKNCMSYIANSNIREKVGIEGRWLFASTGFCSMRSYDSLKTVITECSLKAPAKITSVTLRKYMATLTQVMDLKDGELQWACDHLGHTKAVHLSHYRQMSGFIERVKMANLILVQDMNLAGALKGKQLADQQVDELLTKKLQEEMNTDTQVDSETTEINVKFIEDNTDLDIDMDVLFEDEDVTETAAPSKKSVSRKRWTEEEIKELKFYFADNLKTKTCPSQKQCMMAIQNSSKKNGLLSKRYWHNIVKKISNMNKK
ncbi:uncharacterized protein LOC117340354 [Pecten maximus]|uniref:uncharacterized protein LOC117340354 n=1 Tax=Pecten maximus TaxID=6579 RepID=UPI001458E63F|nr:uncharacterized protein LOC117340354 [Pecten maximus]